MEKGQILYFVSVDNGVIKKHMIREIQVTPTGINKKVEIIRLYNMAHSFRKELLPINPLPENFWNSNTKIGYGKKCYLVFTDKDKAEQALFGYVLPKIIEDKQNQADETLRKYQNIISEIGEIEKRIQKSKA